MTLPSHKSRRLEVRGESYRWTVSTAPHDQLAVTIEPDERPGNLLIAHLDRQLAFCRGRSGEWEHSRQLRIITPSLVADLIAAAIDAGWQPESPDSGQFVLHHEMIAEIERLHPPLQPRRREICIRDLAHRELNDLIFDISLDPTWRERLRNAEAGKLFDVSPSELSWEAAKNELHFVAFLDGYTDDGWFVIGVRCEDFPAIKVYSSNNPATL